ncbi:YolD-like family protein [Heyndrickxia shackletonii]|uniref:YolD-like family protein n=1 Tax=Heyndrickxia shackletonii TaxID=157838 RepID=UPI0006EC1AD2|nr:YolD-like family protein [Heyndrickxia shackletonii]NEY99226.1 YolD-like family protein [Heyndrickxia shackletonii]
MDIDNIKDRGLAKKWQGFFMPEHVEGLKQMWIDQKKIQMPLLDDYQIQEFEERIKYAKDYKLPVEFTLFDNGFTDVIIGRIHSFDQLKQKIKLILDDNTVEYILFSEIMNVQIQD